MDNEDFFSDLRITPAESLPEGWNWGQYDDGSGSLRSPSGKHLFSYDLAPYHSIGGIEYQKIDHSRWDIFWGTFAEFKKYAEERAKEKFMEE